MDPSRTSGVRRARSSADCWGTWSAGTRLIRAGAALIAVALVVELGGSVRSLVQSGGQGDAG
jgi:hypothetical protein